MPIRITVTGDLGSGKSTVCKELHDKYHLHVFSTGIIQRKIAVEKGMSTFDLNKYMELHPEIDQQLDDELKKLSFSFDDIAIDSRMAWHFVDETYKVFLTTDETVAAQRVIADQRGPSEAYADVQDAKDQLKARKVSENYRYKLKYGVDCYDLRNFDLIVDTTLVPPDTVAAIIMEQYNDWALEKKAPCFLISPVCLYPTQSIRDISIETIEHYYKTIMCRKFAMPVDIVSSDGMFYIYDGHHRACAYFKCNELLVPCSLIAQNSDAISGGLSVDRYVKGEFNLSKACDWEDFNGFQYFTYPR